MQTLSFKSRSNSWWNGSPTVSTLEVTLKPGFLLWEQKDDGHGVRYIWDEKEGWTHVLGYRSQCKVPAHLLRQACLFQILCLGKPQTQTVLYTLLLVLIFATHYTQHLCLHWRSTACSTDFPPLSLWSMSSRGMHWGIQQAEVLEDKAGNWSAWEALIGSRLGALSIGLATTPSLVRALVPVNPLLFHFFLWPACLPLSVVPYCMHCQGQKKDKENLVAVTAWLSIECCPSKVFIDW